MVVGPGIAAEHDETMITEHTDLAPTILSLMGVPSSELLGFDGCPMFDRDRAPRGFATIVPVQKGGPGSRAIGFLVAAGGIRVPAGVGATDGRLEGAAAAFRRLRSEPALAGEGHHLPALVRRLPRSVPAHVPSTGQRHRAADLHAPGGYSSGGPRMSPTTGVAPIAAAHRRLAHVALAVLLSTSIARAQGGADAGMSMSPPSTVPTVSNPDRPTRTTSGKVHASRDPKLPPALGPTPAKVIVIVYSDFQCPVCARVTDATHQIPEEWPGEVRVEFRQHPLPIHPNAENAAVAALAAHRQGKFWEMHDVLFKNQGGLDPASLETYAQGLGLDVAKFRKDVADPELRARVKREGALADRLGANGTPGFLINGRLSLGWGSWFGFRGLVQDELTAVNALLAKGTKLAAVHALRAKANAKDEAAFAAYKAGVIDGGARASSPK